MENKRWVTSLIAVWTGVIALFLYIPIFSVITSSFGKSRYFRFPVKAWSDKWYDQTLGANLTTDLHLTSFYVAGCVALIAVVLGFFGALAFRPLQLARAPVLSAPSSCCRSSSPRPCSAWRSCSGSLCRRAAELGGAVFAHLSGSCRS